MSKFAKSTGELFTELKAEKISDDWRNRNANEFTEPFHEYLLKLLREKGFERKDIIERSGLDRSYVYHIFNGNRNNPSRQKLLALAIAMNLNLDETQYLLRYAKQGALYPRDSWDAVIISALEQNLSVPQTNELLHSLGEEIMLG